MGIIHFYILYSSYRESKNLMLNSEVEQLGGYQREI